MAKQNIAFTEIEYKWLLKEDFDLDGIRLRLKSMNVEETYCVNVRDSYFILERDLGRIYRHRFDERSQQLTVKSAMGNDISQRQEINLVLDQRAGDQIEAVRAFLQTSRQEIWEGAITKQVEVFYLPEVELVIYTARNHQGKICYCLEIEARRPASVMKAFEVLDHYATVFGMDPRHREKRSLFELLLKDQLMQTPS